MQCVTLPWTVPESWVLSFSWLQTVVRLYMDGECTFAYDDKESFESNQRLFLCSSFDDSILFICFFLSTF